MFTMFIMLGLKKKLDALSKEKDCSVASEWRRSLTNHLYWCACTSNGDGELMLAKWESVADHMQDIHTNHDNPLFPSCQHKKLKGRERQKKWLKPGWYKLSAACGVLTCTDGLRRCSLFHCTGTKVCEKMVKIINSTYLRNDVKKLSPQVQTSSVEVFHSVINHFAPKMLSFTYEGITCRLVPYKVHLKMVIVLSC